jgi:hypothetical protein
MSHSSSIHAPAAADAGIRDAPLLRFALRFDALTTAVGGVGYVAAFALLDGWLGLPSGLLIAVGVALAAYGLLVWQLAARPAMPRIAVVAVIAANAIWAVDSFVLLALDGFSPTLAGQILIAVQAVAVAGYAALQYLGLRRADR